MAEQHSQQQQAKEDYLEELSVTLIERRKRLHELATEINQWQDESNKHLLTPTAMELLGNKTGVCTSNSAHASPKTTIIGLPSPSTSFMNTTANNNNKENKTPTNASSSNAAKRIVTPSSNEILSVAQRILAKRQSNTNAESPSLVKTMRSKFENPTDESSTVVQTELLPPKMLIKKFEQMSKESSAAAAAQPSSSAGAGAASHLNTQLSAKKLNEKKSSIVSQPAVPPTATTTTTSTPSPINKSSEHIRPKKIIEKFEQMVKCGGAEKKRPTGSTAAATAAGTYVVNNSIACSASLTYVSSYQSSANNSPDMNEYFDYEKEPTTNRMAVTPNSEQANETNELTSLFEQSTSLSPNSSPNRGGGGRRRAKINYTDESSTNPDNEEEEEDEEEETTEFGTTQDGYSISGSSYTGSLINQDDFESTYDDDDDNNDAGANCGAADQTDEYDSINDDDDQDQDRESRTNESEMDDVETTLRQTDTTQTNSECGTAVAAAPSSSSSCSVAHSTNESAATRDLIESEPLFSIQEYRKQTRTMRNHGRRRSSLAAAKSSSGNNSSANKGAGGRAGGTGNKIAPISSNLASISENSEEQNKKMKYLERIKELEEFIKQEDNIIYQTGIALEKCLTDAQFTGSSEHIECNRILLISCQKRQAFLTEVNRLKQLSSNLNIQNNRATATNAPLLADSYDLSSSDLTGLLIFSDLQLPVKELYINKLKSGDEKRVFYFICLIRNGIQVLQTQVISVQELIPTKETCITFPNRMAINNVDINFKVKIDIYAMEVLPKDYSSKTIKQNSHSSSSSSSSHCSSKFFSPFKNNLFHHISSNHHHTNNANNNALLMNTNNAASNSHHSNSGISSLGAKTSNFIHIDTVEITNRDIYSNKFKLNISSSSIPLTGSLFVNVRCMPSKSIELKGFMTLFEDINGLGSWDRRWCFLNNYSISFWKYPEDEYRNGPLGTINLTKCINETVSLLPRDLCARKYTIELIIYDTEAQNSQQQQQQQQQQHHQHDESSKTQNEKFKYKRYRLSADTKDQATDWLTNINYALANLRIWNPKAMKPPTSSNNNNSNLKK